MISSAGFFQVSGPITGGVAPTRASAGDSPEERELQEIQSRWEQAAMVRNLWQPILQDCHMFAMPNRDLYYTSVEGQRRTDRIFDSTAVVSNQEFASRLQAGLTPNYTDWAIFEPGPQVTDPQERHQWKQGLQQIQDLFFQYLHASNFNGQSHECYQDLGIGTCAMLIEDGDIDHPFKFTSVPLTQVWIERGTFSGIEAVYRPLEVPVEELRTKWPDFKFDRELFETLRDNPRKRVRVVECTINDPKRRDTEAARYRVICVEGTARIAVSRMFEGEGSNPWVCARWSVVGGETYGRGPLMSALPDIKTANAVVELILENAEMAIAGMWQYEDDGTIDAAQVALLPGTLIPHGVGTKGLEPLAPGCDFNIGFEVLKELQSSIKRALFDEMLGPVDKTPMSAAEVHVRMADMARRIGSPYGRLQYEFLQPIVRRCMYILKQRGIIKIPRLGKGYVHIVPTSPLARQQRYAAEVQATEQLLTIGMQSFGPQMINLIFKGDATMMRLAEDLGVPTDILRNDVERQQLAQQMAQMAAHAVQQGAPQQQQAA